ncbi:MAG: hypothetical protein ABSG05_01330 [Candidatus Pacearchaeota archaeon]|jgi:cation transport ATPase
MEEEDDNDVAKVKKNPFRKEVASIKWKQPERFEVLLILFYLFSWYLFNDMFNLISIEGLGSTGNFFNGLNIPAWIPFVLSFIVMIFALVTFIMRSTFDKSSHKILNTFVGIWIFLGLFLMLVSVVLMLQGLGPSYSVPWLFNLTRNSIYHLGVFLFQIPGVIYFALFE